MTYTRTRTYYWGEDDTADLRKKVDEMATDWDQRRAHVPSPIRQQGDQRLNLLRAVVELVSEAAVE